MKMLKLIKRGMKFLSINKKDENGNTKLHKAVLEGNVNNVYDLIKAGANVNAKGGYGNTPLHLAVKHGKKEIVRLLLENRAELNAKDKDGKIPLHHAAFTGEIDTIKDLLDHGSSMDAVDHRGETPLHIAAWAQNTDAAWAQNTDAAWAQNTDAAWAQNTDAARLLITYALTKNPEAQKPTFLKRYNQLSEYFDKRKSEIQIMRRPIGGEVNNLSRPYLTKLKASHEVYPTKSRELTKSLVKMKIEKRVGGFVIK